MISNKYFLLETVEDISYIYSYELFSSEVKIDCHFILKSSLTSIQSIFIKHSHDKIHIIYGDGIDNVFHLIENVVATTVF